MSVSLPSKEVIIIDVPEIRNFHAKFQYNFHVPEEGIDKYDNSAYRFVVKKPTDQFDAKSSTRLRRRHCPVLHKTKLDCCLLWLSVVERQVWR
jgi:hypothetical protein